MRAKYNTFIFGSFVFIFDLYFKKTIFVPIVVF